MARKALSCAALLACAFPLAAQQRTLVVDQTTGPYSEIAQAIGAARPGDRIEVHPPVNPPNNPAYATFTVTFGLDIDVTQGATVSRVMIQNVASNQAVRIYGLTVMNITDTQPRMQIANCAGAVHLHGVTVHGGIVVTNSPVVALSSCTVDGNPWFNLAFVGVQCTGSNVAIHGSTITGGQGVQTGGPATDRDGRTGILLAGGAVVLTASQVFGGPGFDSSPLGCSLLPPPGNGGVGIGGSGQVTAADGGSISGGRRGFGACPAYDGPAFAGLTARVAPSVTVGQGGAPPVAIAEPPSLSAPTTVPVGTMVIVGVSGVSNRFVLLGLDLWNGWQRLPPAELPFLLWPTASLVAFAPATPAPSTSFAIPIPAVPWLQNQFAHLQAVTVDAGGGIEFSNGGYMRLR